MGNILVMENQQVHLHTLILHNIYINVNEVDFLS